MKTKHWVSISPGIMLALALFITPPAITPARAVIPGIPVLDGSNLSQNIVTALESVAQDLNQLAQYRNMLRNTMALIDDPLGWVNTEDIIDTLLNFTDTVNQARQITEAINDVMGGFKDITGYSQMPCFRLNGSCAVDDLRRMREARVDGSKVWKSATDDIQRRLKAQRNQLHDEAGHLKELRNNAVSAEGRLTAMNYANAIGATMTSQLMQIRALLMGQQRALMLRDAKSQDNEALQHVQHEHITTFTEEPDYEPASWLF